MKKIAFALSILGLSVFAIGCSHNKQKVVFVTERFQCEKYEVMGGGFGKCSSRPDATSIYRGYNNNKVSNQVEAASSICGANDMFKSEFTDKVNSDEFRIVSTTEWEQEFPGYTISGIYHDGKSFIHNKKVRCIGKEYVVTY